MWIKGIHYTQGINKSFWVNPALFRFKVTRTICKSKNGPSYGHMRLCSSQMVQKTFFCYNITHAVF